MASGALTLHGGQASVEKGEKRASDAGNGELSWSPAEGVSRAKLGGGSLSGGGSQGNESLCPGWSEFGVYEQGSKCKTRFFF